MRGPVMVAAMAVVLAALMAGPVCATRPTDQQSATEALQAIHEAAMAGMIGSAEVQYPNRPSVFRSPGELRQYLDALNAYYAIAGRPRFGKRGMSSAQKADLYDY